MRAPARRPHHTGAPRPSAAPADTEALRQALEAERAAQAAEAARQQKELLEMQNKVLMEQVEQRCAA